jgi:hypothetical protein
MATSDMSQSVKRSFFKLALKLAPFGFLLGFAVTFLPPKPSNAEYVRTHPPSMKERCIFGVIVSWYFR